VFAARFDLNGFGSTLYATTGFPGAGARSGTGVSGRRGVDPGVGDDGPPEAAWFRKTKNSATSISPEPSPSTARAQLSSSSSVAWKPSALSESVSSVREICPLPSRSIPQNACRYLRERRGELVS